MISFSDSSRLVHLAQIVTNTQQATKRCSSVHEKAFRNTFNAAKNATSSVRDTAAQGTRTLQLAYNASHDMALETILDMWRSVLQYTLAVNTFLFTICGLAATVIHVTGPSETRSPRWVLSALCAPILGVVIGFILGSVPAFLLAAVYFNVPAKMSEYAALGWGCGQGFLIALLNAGVFKRII